MSLSIARRTDLLLNFQEAGGPAKFKFRGARPLLVRGLPAAAQSISQHVIDFGN